MSLFFKKSVNIPTSVLILAIFLTVLITPNILLVKESYAATVPVKRIDLFVDIAEWVRDWGAQIAMKGYEAIISRITNLDWITKQLEKAARFALVIFLQLLLARITNDIINWVLGGGQPRFVEDLGGFLGDIADDVGGVFVNELLGTNLCEPFRPQITIDLSPPPTFPDRVACSLSEIVTNINNFYDQFESGGFKAWFRANSVSKWADDYTSLYLNSLLEMEQRIFQSQNTAAQDYLTGRGFISHRVCRQWEFDTVDGSGRPITITGTDIKQPNQIAADMRCLKWSTSTPAAMIENLVDEVINSPIKAIRESIAANIGNTGLQGILKPFLLAISDAVIMRIIREGFSLINTTNSPDAYRPITDTRTSRPDFDGIGRDRGDTIENNPEFAADSVVQEAEDKAHIQPLIVSLEDYEISLREILLPEQTTKLNRRRNLYNAQLDALSIIKSLVDNSCPLLPFGVIPPSSRPGVFQVFHDPNRPHTKIGIIDENGRLIPAIEEEYLAAQQEKNATLSLIDSADLAITRAENYKTLLQPPIIDITDINLQNARADLFDSVRDITNNNSSLMSDQMNALLIVSLDANTKAGGLIMTNQNEQETFQERIRLANDKTAEATALLDSCLNPIEEIEIPVPGI